MDLVNEQHLLVLHVSDDRGQVAFNLQERRRRGLKVHAQFIGDNVRQRGLAQARRPVEKHVVHRLSAGACRLNRHRQIFFDFLLSDEFGQPLRSQLQLK